MHNVLERKNMYFVKKYFFQNFSFRLDLLIFYRKTFKKILFLGGVCKKTVFVARGGGFTPSLITTYCSRNKQRSVENLSLHCILFRKSLDLSVLTERRVLAPYGMAGGRPALKGQNTLVTKDVEKSLKAKCLPRTYKKTSYANLFNLLYKL